MNEIDKLDLMARCLYMAAKEAGQVKLVRGLIQDAMKFSIEMCSLPKDNEPDDPEEMTTIVGCFAASWDEFDRVLREDD